MCAGGYYTTRKSTQRHLDKTEEQWHPTMLFAVPGAHQPKVGFNPGLAYAIAVLSGSTCPS